MAFIKKQLTKEFQRKVRGKGIQSNSYRQHLLTERKKERRREREIISQINETL